MRGSMMKTIIATDKAPGAIGPYSQAIKVNGMVYTSGQLGINPVTGDMPGNVEAQTEQALQNIGAILASQKLDFSDVFKVLIFLRNMDNFERVNRVYGKYFTEDFPARSCVEVARLPKNALVEIEVIALCRDK